MNFTDLKKSLKYFREYSDSDYHQYLREPEPAKWYSHRDQDYFHIIVFRKSGEVFQGGTEADVIGQEILTYEDLLIRYESFTGFKIDEIDES